MKYATLFVSSLIIIAVLIPGKNLPDVGVGGVDKLVHIGMFMLWAVAARYDVRAGRHNFFWLLFFVGMIFSFITEVLQLLVEGRSFDVYDMAADAIGLVLGLLTGRIVIRLLTVDR